LIVATNTAIGRSHNEWKPSYNIRLELLPPLQLANVVVVFIRVLADTTATAIINTNTATLLPLPRRSSTKFATEVFTSAAFAATTL
jgi:hypothetical protein